MIACVPLRPWFGATPEPPSDGNRGQNVLIRSPGQRARNPLRQRTGVSRNRTRKFDIGGQRMYSYRHRLPSLADVLTPCSNLRKKSDWKAEQVVLVFQSTASKTVPGEELCPGRTRWMRGTDQWRREPWVLDEAHCCGCWAYRCRSFCCSRSSGTIKPAAPVRRACRPKGLSKCPEQPADVIFMPQLAHAYRTRVDPWPVKPSLLPDIADGTLGAVPHPRSTWQGPTPKSRMEVF